VNDQFWKFGCYVLLNISHAIINDQQVHVSPILRALR
jgi:hypothetical protein